MYVRDAKTRLHLFLTRLSELRLQCERPMNRFCLVCSFIFVSLLKHIVVAVCLIKRYYGHSESVNVPNNWMGAAARKPHPVIQCVSLD